MVLYKRLRMQCQLQQGLGYFNGMTRATSHYVAHRPNESLLDQKKYSYQNLSRDSNHISTYLSYLLIGKLDRYNLRKLFHIYIGENQFVVNILNETLFQHQSQ